MQPNPKFASCPPNFWAHVRTLSQGMGYTSPGTGQIRIATCDEMVSCASALGLGIAHLVDAKGTPTEFGQCLVDYFRYRADILNRSVESWLMNKS